MSIEAHKSPAATGSSVVRNDLLASVTYPDSVSGSDIVSYAYNRLGQQRTITDQRGTVRTFYYDLLGRLTNDCVTTVGSNTDNAVLQIERAYEVRGMVQTITSTNNATQGSGTVLNQVQLTYNTFGQLVEDQQSHSGAVGGGTPSVQYAYDTGGSSSNEIRLNQLTYPNGRTIAYSYGSSGGMSDYLNRVDSIQDTTSGTTTLSEYVYLGLSTVIRITCPEPSVWLDLWGGTSGTFNGIDQFGRVINQLWQNNITGTPVAIDQYQYGYDQDSNRLWKANVVGTAVVTAGLDEFYVYDPLNRLTEMQRGVLNSGKTGITGTPSVEQDWTLDAVGNWSGFITKASGTTNLNQSRTANKVNEITNITESTGPTWIVPAYDAAGNTITMPQPASPTSSFTAVYDAWNRMVSISAGSTPVGKYQYDGRNFRIVKQTYSGGTLSETRDFYYTAGWQDIEENVSGSMVDQYVWGIRYIDELVCRDDATPERFYACQDANFNLTSITDTSGSVQERYLFDPYGDRTIMNGSWGVISASNYGWVIGFQGLMLDLESGAIYNRMRYLWLGIFPSRDPVGYDGGSLSLYEYCGSNPTGRTDAAGLATIGGWSGIGFPDWNYVIEPRYWQYNGWLPQFNQAYSELSDLGMLQTGLLGQGTLDAEFDRRLAENWPVGKLCCGPKKSIRILMLAPATGARPSVDVMAGNCCDVKGTIVFNPYDLAMNTTFLGYNRFSDRQQQAAGWADVQPVDNTVLGGHGPAGIVGNYDLPTLSIIYPPRGARGTAALPRISSAGGSFNPAWWLEKYGDPASPNYVGDDGYIFVCHSQGCNNLMKAINRGCTNE